MIKITNKIKMVISDFDGVFTDGSIYFDEELHEQKRLNFKDIQGVSMLIKNNIRFAIVSGETSNILNYFKEKFDINEIHGGIRQKGPVVADIMQRHNLSPDEVLYIGDDINDIPAFELVENKIAPNNANPVIKNIKGIKVTAQTGGMGAFREMVDSLLKQ